MYTVINNSDSKTIRMSQKSKPREQIFWETTQRPKIYRTIDRFHDGDEKQMLIDIMLTSKQRADIHEYVKTKGLFTQTIDTQGAYNHKKIAVLRNKDEPIVFHTNDQTEGQEAHPNPSAQPGPDDVSFFIEFTGIHIPVNDLDDIAYFLDLYDGLHSAKAKWEQFVTESKTMNLKDEKQRVQQKIIADISGNQGFVDLTKQRLQGPVNQLRADPYTFEKVGKIFISIDIRAGNFTVLRDAVPEIFQKGEDLMDWHEYVRQFTDSEFIAQSKFFRELVFGLLPGYMQKARTLQEIFMDQVHDVITKMDVNQAPDNPCGQNLVLVMKHGDELIYEIQDYWNTVGSDTHGLSIQKIMDALGPDSLKLHFRVYELNQIPVIDKPWYYKTWLFNDGQELGPNIGQILEFKGVPKIFKAQVVKWYLNQPLDPRDLLFTHEKLRARFEKPIF